MSYGWSDSWLDDSIVGFFESSEDGLSDAFEDGVADDSIEKDTFNEGSLNGSSDVSRDGSSEVLIGSRKVLLEKKLELEHLFAEMK